MSTGCPPCSRPAGGPTHAGLVFRVGTADEPLPLRGITRLVERLVTDVPGTTGPEHTYFHRGVRPKRSLVPAVSGGLRDPPTDRLAAVKERLPAVRPGQP